MNDHCDWVEYAIMQHGLQGFDDQIEADLAAVVRGFGIVEFDRRLAMLVRAYARL
jgi:hypothetical protein